MMIPYEIARTAINSATPYMQNAIEFGAQQIRSQPVPEFSGLAVVAFSALAASLYLLRRRRK